MRSLTGCGLPSRGRCCSPIGRSCDGESRDVAPAASSDAPTRCGSPPASSSARRSTIRTSELDRVRPAGSLSRGQPRHAATRERSGSRSSAQRPTHGREATRVRMWPRRPDQFSRRTSLAPLAFSQRSAPEWPRHGPGETQGAEAPLVLSRAQWAPASDAAASHPHAVSSGGRSQARGAEASCPF
jgi:hypothetical protein